MAKYYDNKYLLIDTETSGFDPDQHAILEVGAQVLDGRLNKVSTGSKPYHAFIQPHAGAVLDEKALHVNGLHWAKDADSEDFKKALEPLVFWEQFKAWLQTEYEEASWIVLVGWNVGFDERAFQGFYRRHMGEEPRLGQTSWPFHYHKIDLLGVSRYLDARHGKERCSYKLETLCQEYFGTVAEFAMHTALGDSEMCLRVTHTLEEEFLRDQEAGKKEEKEA